MGFRTVVVLVNDRTGDWANDPNLGQHIAHAMNMPGDRHLGYGRVVECAHADVQTLGILHDYQFTPLAHNHWHPTQEASGLELRMLQQAAEKLGYRLMKTT